LSTATSKHTAASHDGRAAPAHVARDAGDGWPVVTRGLTKRYDEITAADGVDLAVAAGSIHGLVGANGAGKSTVLGSILGLVAPDAGDVAILGGARERAAARATGGLAGFVDDPRFYPYLTGRQNLRLLGVLDGMSGSERARRVEELLGRVGLADSADRKVSGYSLGMRQRLGLASALLREPSVLVLDEPTNGLDPAGTRELWTLLSAITEAGGAVLLSSHDLAAVDEVCDAVTIMRSGRTVWTGPVTALHRNAPPPFLRAETADDEAAVAVAAKVGVPAERDPAGGMRVAAGPGELDAVTVALGRAGIGLRSLVPGESSLRALFGELTAGGSISEALAAEATPPPGLLGNADALGVAADTVAGTQAGQAVAPTPSFVADVVAVFRVEARKLAGQWRVRLLALVCLVAPFIFAGGISLSGTLPSDTLYGRWLQAASPALPLVALAVTGSWAFPLLGSVVGGDILASEDKLGTWPTLLTRSRSAAALISGKCLMAVVCAVLAVALLAAATVGAGLALGGSGPLPGLSGQLLSPGHAYALVAACWAATLPGALAWVAIALALSAVTRSALIGIAAPALLGILLQLTLLFDAPPFVRVIFPSSALDAWHTLFESPASIAPLVAAMLVALAWAIIGASGLATVLRRRGSLAA
jgi:ABC-2 type transport system ATP-binding protein